VEKCSTEIGFLPDQFDRVGASFLHRSISGPLAPRSARSWRRGPPACRAVSIESKSRVGEAFTIDPPEGSPSACPRLRSGPAPAATGVRDYVGDFDRLQFLSVSTPAAAGRTGSGRAAPTAPATVCETIAPCRVSLMVFPTALRGRRPISSATIRSDHTPRHIAGPRAWVDVGDL